MICESCNTQFKSERQSKAVSLYGLCESCGTKLKYQRVLSGYLSGLCFSGLPIVLFIFLSIGKWPIAAATIIGSGLVYFMLYMAAKAQGTARYYSSSEIKSGNTFQAVLGGLAGVLSIFLWFFLSIEYFQ